MSRKFFALLLLGVLSVGAAGISALGDHGNTPCDGCGPAPVPCGGCDGCGGGCGDPCGEGDCDNDYDDDCDD